MTIRMHGRSGAPSTQRRKGTHDVDAVQSRSDPARAAVLVADATSRRSGIADSVVKRRFRRGEIVVEQGKKSNALFILLTGRARVLTADSRGREVILAVLQPGDYVGEMSLIDNEPHSATVRAEVQTDMLILGRAEFARCLPENSSLSYAIMRGLVQRLRSADRQIESLALLDVYGRVARTLLDMAERWTASQDHPQQGLAPGPGQGGRRLARDGQPGHEGPGRARHDRDAGERLGDHQGTAARCSTDQLGRRQLGARRRLHRPQSRP